MCPYAWPMTEACTRPTPEPDDFDVLAYEQQSILHAVDVLILSSKIQYKRMQAAALKVHNTVKSDPGHAHAAQRLLR